MKNCRAYISAKGLCVLSSSPRVPDIELRVVILELFVGADVTDRPEMATIICIAYLNI